jgi:hypothetical protein
MKFRLLVTYRYRRNRTCRSVLSTGTFTLHHSRIDRDDLRAMDGQDSSVDFRDRFHTARNHMAVTYISLTLGPSLSLSLSLSSGREVSKVEKQLLH